MNVLYDGSFEGFLTLVYDVYYEALTPSSIIKTEPKELLFETLHLIFTDETKAHKVLLALQNKFSKEHFQRIFHIFLCDSISFEMELLAFIVLGFKEQKALENITIPAVFKLQSMERELLRLTHKMYGFTRFEELEDGTLYVKIETKFNVLPFLGEHFRKRLGNHAFIIHDINRSLAFIKDKTSMSIKEVAAFETPLLSQNETHVRELWKTFFTHVAIENRRNEKLQKSLVPLLYRTYMSEFLA
jgi:probable DNA metabolism protein